MSREYTNLLLEELREGMLDPDTVIMACLKAMSEDDVRYMMEANDFIPDRDEDDGQPTEREEWADFDVDC